MLFAGAAGLGDAAATSSPAVGWPIWIALLLLYYAANFMLLGALFLGIGGQASNIREIQTISMPVTLLQLMVLLLAMNAIGGEKRRRWPGSPIWCRSARPWRWSRYGAQYESALAASSRAGLAGACGS